MALQGNREAFGVPVRRRVLPNVCGTTGVDAGLVLMPRAWRSTGGGRVEGECPAVVCVGQGLVGSLSSARLM